MNDRREQIENEITALKMLLNSTDYQVTKYAEGLTACSTQKEENAFREEFMAKYGEVIANRIAWRERINELEEERDALPPDVPEEPEPPVIEDEENDSEIVHEESEEDGVLLIDEEEDDAEIIHDEEDEAEPDEGEPEIVPEPEPEADPEPEQ